MTMTVSRLFSTTQQKLNLPKFGLFASVLMLVFLSGCQSASYIGMSPFTKLPKPTSKQVVMSEKEVKAVLDEQSEKASAAFKNRDVAFHCSGLYGCDIASIDRQPVISHRSGKPYRSAVRKRLLYIKKNQASANTSASLSVNKFSYVGLMSEGEHLVNIRFYPISEGAFENFAVRHSFKKDKVYRFHGYRKPVDDAQHEDVSLLALASPRPMCIALYEGRKPIRQFCKEADIITGVGRFVEEPVSDVDKDKPTLMDGFQDDFFNRFSKG